MTVVQNFIGGELADSVSGATMPLVDPRTGEKYGTAPISNAQDIDNAYGAAAKAFKEWKRTTPSHRQKALLDFADDIEKAAADLVAAEGRNTGKPDHVTMAEEIPPMLDQIRFFAGAARLLEGKSAGEYLADHTSWIRREPVGVIGQVAPWNYPMMMAIWKAHQARHGLHRLSSLAHVSTCREIAFQVVSAPKSQPWLLFRVGCRPEFLERALDGHHVDQQWRGVA